MSDIANYWAVTASADHAARGKAERIVQANHGKDGPLRRMTPGDGVVIYSPRSTCPDGPPLQAFTLIGRVSEAEPYQGPQLMWRRAVIWQEARWAPIQPLLADLDLTRDLKSWGMAFRYGLTKLTRADFARIARAMLDPVQDGAISAACVLPGGA